MEFLYILSGQLLAKRRASCQSVINYEPRKSRRNPGFCRDSKAFNNFKLTTYKNKNYENLL
jgi:hypothetical protein